ncbi:MBL fold metallo-hydrolase [Planctomicrobium sp. SH668]|uniref:MBL fold metallo-hydrolase n=1 Tax=Planctomicrobium sp. SH668 TaxID=3448126 RepID=UPI003F5B94AA
MWDRHCFQVTDSIWCVRQPSYLTCTYGIACDAGVVFIDAGMDSTGSDLLALLEAMNRKPEEVHCILLTHWHNDHAAGARAFQQKTGCSVFFHQLEEPWLTRETAHQGVRGWLAKRIPEWGIGILLIGLLGEAVPEAVTATRYISDGDVIAGDFEVIATPGHTPGHVSFYYRPEKALIAGDALAVINGQVRFMARPVTMDLEAARASMIKCLDRDIQVLCPGHREPLTTGVGATCDRMRAHLARQGNWPLFG